MRNLKSKRIATSAALMGLFMCLSVPLFAQTAVDIGTGEVAFTDEDKILIGEWYPGDSDPERVWCSLNNTVTGEYSNVVDYLFFHENQTVRVALTENAIHCVNQATSSHCSLVSAKSVDIVFTASNEGEEMMITTLLVAKATNAKIDLRLLPKDATVDDTCKLAYINLKSK